MEGILKFNLTEEQEEFDNAVNGWKWKDVVWEIDSYLRNKIKYGEKDIEIYEELRNKLLELREDHNLTLDS